MRLICYIDGVETPIVDGSIPNVPGARTIVFWQDKQGDCQLVLDAVAGPDSTILSGWLEPHGLKASPLP